MTSVVRRPTPAPVLVALVALVVAAATAPGVALAGIDGGTTRVDGGTTAMTAAGGVDGVDAASAAGFAAQSSANNTTETVQHRDPATHRDESDLRGVEAWLGRQLAERLRGSTVAVSRGDYERASDLLGDRYDALLGKYVSVAGNASGEAERDPAESFEDARRTHREYATAVRAYRETHRAYRAAERRGNETRARHLARRLERLETRVDRSAANLTATYDAVSNASGENASSPTSRVRGVAANVSDRQAAVRAAEFEPTELRLAAASADVSFLDPVRLRGRLAVANGSGLAGERVLLRVGNDTTRVTTDERGRFDLAYRPTRLSAGAQNLSVEYVPGNVSPFLGANASVPVSVSPVEPTVALTRAPETAAYADRFPVAGTVRAGDVPVPGVPVVVTADGVVLGRTHTTATGSFEVHATLPASVRAGERTVRARVDQSGRAIAGVETTTPVRVAATNTSLSLRVAPTDGTIRVRGRLTTASGDPVAGRNVRVDVAGEAAATLRTNATGGYEATVAVPRSLRERDGRVNASVLATFTGPGTSLEPSRAERSLLLGRGERDDAPWDRFAEVRPWLAAVGLVALAMGGLYVARLRAGRAADPTTRRVTDDARSVDDGRAAATSDLLADAERLLAAGDADAAVEVAYGAVRRRLAGEFDADASSTHWEFLRAQRAADSDGRRVDLHALRALTAAYDRAAFAATDLDPDEAAAALRSAADAVRDER